MWRFIETNLPNYYTRDDVLRSDILLRFIENDDVWGEDLKWIEEEFKSDIHLVKKELVRLETRFITESLRSYYGIER